MALVFGLTGGIASGKSTVSATFRAAGVHVVDADLVAREVVRPGTSGLMAVVTVFGDRFLSPEGTLDRKALGAHVFASDLERRKLDETLGPFIRRAIDRDVELGLQQKRVVCVDAALLIEKGMHERFRPLVVVTVRPETQIARIMKRDGLSEAEARARLASQLPAAEKARLADFLIENEGSVEELQLRALDVLGAVQKYRPSQP